MHGDAILKKQGAKKVRDLSLKAITDLSKILTVSKAHCTDQEFNNLRRAVGMCIAQVESELLVGIYSEYPELDDLK